MFPFTLGGIRPFLFPCRPAVSRDSEVAEGALLQYRGYAGVRVARCVKRALGSGVGLYDVTGWHVENWISAGGASS